MCLLSSVNKCIDNYQVNYLVTISGSLVYFALRPESIRLVSRLCHAEIFLGIPFHSITTTRSMIMV